VGGVAARVQVVGAGIAGAACARALRAAGVDVTVRERGRAVGGRLASPELHGRRVDLGAAYLTVNDDAFATLVADWTARGRVREWTDTFTVFGADGRTSTSGPMRYSAPHGLRSLARDLHGEVELDHEVREVVDRDVTVLAMPDPQAARLAGNLIDWVAYEPVISIALGFPDRLWELDAAFVNDDPDVALIADDGARRGDGAPVLVVHSTPELARAHLSHPDTATAPALAAAQRLLGISVAPAWTHAHRWTFARPVGTHGDAPFWWHERLAVCGDSWCPSGAPRVESAWLSGHRLGVELAGALGSAR
jgi:predicted NAD/FAD-dependent oxidoreductase